MALFTACGTPKQTTSASSNTDRGRNNVETTSASTSQATSRTARAEASTAAEINRNNEALERENIKRMYNDLKMTREQINDFENKWDESMVSWKRNNRNKVMNNYERVEHQDRILKDILTEPQFESYRQWVRQNAGNN